MMQHGVWLEQQAELTLARLWPRIETILSGKDRAAFKMRLDTHFRRLFGLLFELYGSHYDFFYHLEQILLAAAVSYAERPNSLKKLDVQRESERQWFQKETMVGAVAYVDLFAGDLAGMRDRVPYLKELGITYLHLMPLFLAPEENSDGGYAVSSYRDVNPDLGTMTELRDLASELRGEGISLVVDFVFNHTSDEHLWAQQARAGDAQYQSYYWLFDDRTLPDQYEQHLREIFPEQDPGSFTYDTTMQKWAWTTFRSFQWDLNYTNPEVFTAMMGEMLFLANQGVEILRLDAVAFVWKQMGTTCENLPQAHSIIQAYNALVKIAAPAMVFKSEAIVHPDMVAQYISEDECPLSYNPTLMNLLWEALATREVYLLRHSMVRRLPIAEGCTWVNYVRCHDDIGWSFADEDAAELWINGYDHRQFLNRFYTGRFDGSFAKGVPFNYNPINQDMRISGMAASLAGLEKSIDEGSVTHQEYALRRLQLIHSVILSIGGIPLIYLGDELATPNDYSYEDDPNKANDSRWVHRPQYDWDRAENRTDITTVEGQMYTGLLRLINLRKTHPAMANGDSVMIDVANPHVFAYSRQGRILVLANFSEQPQTIAPENISVQWHHAKDIITDEAVTAANGITLSAYEFRWLIPERP